jgi:hypothetical protein
MIDYKYRLSLDTGGGFEFRLRSAAKDAVEQVPHGAPVEDKAGTKRNGGHGPESWSNNPCDWQSRFACFKCS